MICCSGVREASEAERGWAYGRLEREWAEGEACDQRDIVANQDWSKSGDNKVCLLGEDAVLHPIPEC